MWDCWGSSVRRGSIAILIAAALGTGVAGASVRVNGVVLGDSARMVRHVRASRHGVVVASPGETQAFGIDSLGHGAIVIDEGAGMVRFLSDAHVKPGERLEGDVVAIFGNVQVDGDVTGSAVAVFGSVGVGHAGSVGGDAVAVMGGQKSAGQVTGSSVAVLGSLDLQPGASVGGDAVAVGGHVSDAEGSRIAGQVVSLSMLPLTLGMPPLPAALAVIALGWLVSVFFGWMFATLFHGRLARVAVTSSRRTFLSILVAMLSLFLWPIASILIMATIIGLPIGLILWLAYPVIVYAGQLGATYVLGCKLLRRRLGEGPALAPIVAGSLLIAGLFSAGAVCFTLGGIGGALALFFSLVGLLVLLGLTTIGTGAFLLSRAGMLPLELYPAAPAPETAIAS
jgi:hypothetical protein